MDNLVPHATADVVDHHDDEERAEAIAERLEAGAKKLARGPMRQANEPKPRANVVRSSASNSSIASSDVGAMLRSMIACVRLVPSLGSQRGLVETD